MSNYEQKINSLFNFAEHELNIVLLYAIDQ